MSSKKQLVALCPDCQLPMTEDEHSVTCPKCGWTVVSGNHGHWFVGWYGEKADKVGLEQLWKTALLLTNTGGEA